MHYNSGIYDPGTVPASKVLMRFNEKYPEEQFKIKETDSAR